MDLDTSILFSLKTRRKSFFRILKIKYSKFAIYQLLGYEELVNNVLSKNELVIYSLIRDSISDS